MAVEGFPTSRVGVERREKKLKHDMSIVQGLSQPNKPALGSASRYTFTGCSFYFLEQYLRDIG